MKIVAIMMLVFLAVTGCPAANNAENANNAVEEAEDVTPEPCEDAVQ